MSKIDYQKLREIAEKTKIAGEAPVMPFDQRINALNDFMKHFSPDIALALLDELERNQQYIKRRDQENEEIALTVGRLRVELEGKDSKIANLTAERDALREGEMTTITDKKQYPGEQYLNELITNIEFAARAPVEVVRAMAAELQKRREADSAEPVSQTYKFPVNTPCQDAPAHIWLQTAGVWPENGELSELTWCSHNQHHDDTLYVRADLVNGNSPVTPDGWISCSERMPAQDDWILIYSKHGEYMAGQVQGEYVELSDGTLSWLGNALFWMPLPEPPQEVK
ncbi:hypothetical protein QREC_QR292_03140 [Escherichia coli]|uniref:ead/Ea22-like family protein n=3 Tax=Escherichia coli TaxID=562 RepID=UPI00185FBBE7|nr:hypothetical protein QREC_QR292_03140 [Escherichia coli]